MSQVAIRDQNERTSIQSVAFGVGPGGGHLAPQNLGDIVRFAEVMSKADIAIPKHLRGNPGACLAVCMQAMKWEMDPFSVAQKSYKVGDQMAYEAQLIAAVINTRAGLKRRPQIEYEGRDGDRKCRVTFEAVDGSVHVYESPRFAAITTKNSPLWKSDPDQQLGYYSIRAGARRHFPEVILGVYDRDEIEAARDVTPAQPERSSFAARISQPQESTGPREGFDRDFIDAELGGGEESAQPGTVESGQEVSEQADEASQIATEPSVEQEIREADETTSRPNRDPLLRNLLTECAEKLLEVASGPGEPKERQQTLVAMKDAWKGELPDNADDLKRIVDRSNEIIKGSLNVAAAVTLLATELGLEEADIRPRAR